MNNLNLSLIGTGIINLFATQISVESDATGQQIGALPPSFAASGTTTLSSDAVITILGTPVVLAANPTPNTVVPLGLAGATLVLNEPIPFGDGVSSIGITTNAIDLKLVNVALPGGISLNGDVIIAHTTAGLNGTTAVPERSRSA